MTVRQPRCQIWRQECNKRSPGDRSHWTVEEAEWRKNRRTCVCFNVLRTQVWWVKRELYPKIELYCRFCLWIPRRIFAVSADFSRVYDVVYEEEISWSRVNRTVLRMYGTKPYQFNQLIYPYPPREEPAQKEERSASILRHKFKKFPLTPEFFAAMLWPRKKYFLISKRNMRKIRLKIDSPYL